MPDDAREAVKVLPARHATFVYMDRTVGAAELRQNLSRYLRRIEQGERLLVTDRKPSGR